MSRNEYDDVSHLTLPDPKVVNNTYFMEDGSVLDDIAYALLVEKCVDEMIKVPTACAKQVHNIQTKIDTYFVLCVGSQLFDPKNKDNRYRIRNRWKLTRVNRTVYDLYIRFLKTYHKSFLHQAEREI